MIATILDRPGVHARVTMSEPCASAPARDTFLPLSSAAGVTIMASGFGVLGLAVALGLARRDVATTIVIGPDAAMAETETVLLLPRSLEILRSLGVLDAAMRAGRILPAVSLVPPSGPEPGLRCSLRALRDVTACNYAVTLRAVRLRRILLDALRQTGRAEVREPQAAASRPSRDPAEARSVLSVAPLRGHVVVSAEDTPGAIDQALLQAHGCTWKLEAIVTGRGDPESLLAACRDEAGAQRSPLGLLQRRLSRLAGWPRPVQSVALAALRWAMGRGLERALALHVSMLETQPPASSLLFQDRSRVGWRLPDVRLSPTQRIHDLVGPSGLILVSPDDDGVVADARHIGAVLGIPVTLRPIALEQAGFGQCEALYVRPDHVVGLQSGGLQPLRLDDVRAALGQI